jgi:hypothetical protein
MRFFSDSDDTTVVRWYFAESNAPLLGVPSIFYARSWDYDLAQLPLGEIQGSFRSSRNRPPLPRPRSAYGRCGTADQWANGCLTTDPLPAVDPNTELRVCCGPGIVLGLGGGLAGGGIVSPPTMQGAGGGLAGGRGLPFPPVQLGAGGALAGGTFYGAGVPYVGAGGALAGGTFSSPVPVQLGAGGALAGGKFYGGDQELLGVGGALAGGTFYQSVDPATVPGLVEWQTGTADASKDPIHTPCADGDLVFAWGDQSGHAFDLMQGISGQRPIYKVNILNGLPIIRFDGVDDLMDSVYSVGQAQPLTVLFVARQRSGSANVALFDGTVIGHRNALATFSSPNQDSVYSGSAQPNTTFLSDNAWHIWSIVFDGPSTVFSRDGSADESLSSPGTNDLVGLRVGSNVINTAPANADVAEVIVYQGSAAIPYRPGLVLYLNDKWQVY